MGIAGVGELVANFVALSVINDFDEIIFNAFTATDVAELLNGDGK